MSEQFACIDPTPRWKRRLRELIGRAKFHAGTPYRLYVYRHHMRLIHPRWHKWKRLRPIDGPDQDWCQWCGARRPVQ